MATPLPVALTIAGVDPGGGAGVVADLMTFAAHGVFGTVAVAAITVQNTRGITRTRAVASPLLAEQIAAILSDAVPGAVKIGMLGNAPNVSAAARALRKGKAKNVVLDPIVHATSGARLLSRRARRDEARALSDRRARDAEPPGSGGDRGLRDPRRGRPPARRRRPGGPRRPGGAHQGWTRRGPRDPRSLLRRPEIHRVLAYFRIDTEATHGTGCTLSSAIAANLARGAPMPDAVRDGIEYLRRALGRGLYPGKGKGTPGISSECAMYRSRIGSQRAPQIRDLKPQIPINSNDQIPMPKRIPGDEPTVIVYCFRIRIWNLLMIGA